MKTKSEKMVRFELLNYRISPVTLIKRFIAISYLRSVAPVFRENRSSRVACFASEEIGIEINVNGVYEGDHLNSLLRFLRQINFDVSAMSFIDIGANIGNHTLFFAKHFKRGYAYEPNPDAFFLLKFNLAKDTSVDVFNFGLGEESGEVELYQDDANLGAATARFHGQESLTCTVPIKKLDDVYLDEHPLGLLKIDVEGMEFDVLQGAKSTIFNHRPVVVFEYHEAFWANSNLSPLSFFKGREYEIGWFDISSESKSKVEQLFSRMTEIFLGRELKFDLIFGEKIPNRSHTMLVAVPSERLNR